MSRKPTAFGKAEEVPVEVKVMDMDEKMQNQVVAIVKDCLTKTAIEKDLAGEIKRLVQTKFSGSWHCVVGRVFSSYVTYRDKHYIYLYAGGVAVLLYMTP